MKNLKSLSIESRKNLKHNALPVIQNQSTNTSKRISSGNKQNSTHLKDTSITEINESPTTLKPNSLGFISEQKIQHTTHNSQTQRQTNSSNSIKRRDIDSRSEPQNGQSQSATKVYTNRPNTNFQISNDAPLRNKSNEIDKNKESEEIKKQTFCQINKIEGFIEDQKEKIEYQKAKIESGLSQQNIEVNKNSIKQRIKSDTNIHLSPSNNFCSSTQESQDHDNSIRSLTDLNEINEVFEGNETPQNLERVIQTGHKQIKGFKEQEELARMITVLEENRNKNKHFEEINKQGENQQKTQQQPQFQSSKQEEDEDEKKLEMRFLRNEMNFRTILREKFGKKKYSEIKIVFEDDKVQLTDCVLFEQQNDTLKYLELTFSNGNTFNEETLGAIKYIKLRNLQNLVLNFTKSKHTKQLINFSIFNLAYIPRVEINFSPTDKLIYIKDDFYIPIDFSNFQISSNDLRKLNRHLIEFQTTHLRLLLNNNTYLSTATDNKINKTTYSNDLPIKVPKQNKIYTSPALYSDIYTQINKDSDIYEQPYNYSEIYPNHLKEKPKVAINQISSISNENILQEIGNILNKLQEIKISFKNCNLREGDLHKFVHALLQQNTNQQNQTLSNAILESIELNIEGNYPIRESFFTIFKQSNFKRLQSFTLIFDKTSQVLRQYEEQNAFHFIKYLKHINNVKFITNGNQLIYQHTLSQSKCYLSISNLEISPFQLVDIQKALNTSKVTLDLTLDLSNNYKLSYKILKNFLNELYSINNSLPFINNSLPSIIKTLPSINNNSIPSINKSLPLINKNLPLTNRILPPLIYKKQPSINNNLYSNNNSLNSYNKTLDKLNLNLTNTNISELELICLYLTVEHIPNLNIKSDIEISNLIRFTQQHTKLFLHQLGEAIINKEMFSVKFTYLYQQLQKPIFQFTHITINFYYNYALSPDLFEHSFKPFLQYNKKLNSLNLDFNYNCYEPDQVLAIMNTVILAIQSHENQSNKNQSKPFKKIKLSFLNNHQVSLEQLIAMFKKFLICIPQLQNLILITDQYVIEKLNLKPIIFQNLIVHPASIKINKLKDCQLTPKKLYVAKKIVQYQQRYQNVDPEENDDDEMAQSYLLSPKLQDLAVPIRVKTVISSNVIPSAIITYDQNNPTTNQDSLQKSIKQLATNHSYELIFVLCDKYADELEELHQSTQQSEK